ncbi:hypothetical protein KU43_06400 [Mesotoga sp. SC_NapDC2]|nr:hypothetical protein KU43_06400 [Mesotoga sp. SC_NapDC2]
MNRFSQRTAALLAREAELASPKARLATEGDRLLKIRCTLKNKNPLIALKGHPPLIVQENEFVPRSRARICSSFLVKVRTKSRMLKQG